MTRCINVISITFPIINLSLFFTSRETLVIDIDTPCHFKLFYKRKHTTRCSYFSYSPENDDMVYHGRFHNFLQSKFISVFTLCELWVLTMTDHVVVMEKWTKNVRFYRCYFILQVSSSTTHVNSKSITFYRIIFIFYLMQTFGI